MGSPKLTQSRPANVRSTPHPLRKTQAVKAVPLSFLLRRAQLRRIEHLQGERLIRSRSFDLDQCLQLLLALGRENYNESWNPIRWLLMKRLKQSGLLEQCVKSLLRDRILEDIRLHQAAARDGRIIVTLSATIDSRPFTVRPGPRRLFPQARNGALLELLSAYVRCPKPADAQSAELASARERFVEHATPVPPDYHRDLARHKYRCQTFNLPTPCVNLEERGHPTIELAQATARLQLDTDLTVRSHGRHIDPQQATALALIRLDQDKLREAFPLETPTIPEAVVREVLPTPTTLTNGETAIFLLRDLAFSLDASRLDRQVAERLRQYRFGPTFTTLFPDDRRTGLGHVWAKSDARRDRALALYAYLYPTLVATIARGY